MPRPTKTVAVLIPCRNEVRYLKDCLDSVVGNDYPHALLDVVVLDGMSEDGTRGIVEKFAKRYAFVRLLDNPQINKPAALNLGIGSTDSDVVMRMDAHATYATDYISKLVTGLSRHGADNTGGVRESTAARSTWGLAIRLAISHWLAAGDASHRTGVRGDHAREVDTVFCGCYRREVFDRIGGFHSGLLRTQDRELNARLTAAGGRIVLDPTVKCWYQPRTGLRDYARWTFNGGFWVHYADRFTETKMRSWRNAVPTLFLLWHLVAIAAWAWGPVAGSIASAPLLVYAALVAWCSTAEAVRHRRPGLLPSLMVLFPTTHYAYGFGSIAGRIATWVLGKRRVAPPAVTGAAPQRVAA